MREREQRESDEPFVQRTDMALQALERFADPAHDGAMVAQSRVAQSKVEQSDPTVPISHAATAPANPTSERAEIARRVIAFRDRQRLICQQREDYCDAVLAETRAALRGGWEIPRN